MFILAKSSARQSSIAGQRLPISTILNAPKREAARMKERFRTRLLITGLKIRPSPQALRHNASICHFSSVKQRWW
jgi:hypothetical protein